MTKNILIALLFGTFIFASCSTAPLNIFSKKTPIEQYEEKLKDDGLAETPEGRQWLAASESALQHPQLIELPYRQLGNFPADKPRALGLKFTAKRGERLNFTLIKNLPQSFVLYAELYEQDATGKDNLLHATDTSDSTFVYDISETGSYVLKLQPQLLRTGSYHLSIAIGPSLGFPVAYSKANIGSFWDDSRDGGKRRHEGVDIFAPKRTPAIAAVDGYITSVRDGGLGGKTVMLRPVDKNYSLYYAHLDEQLVSEGDFVKQGDTVGLVGNTGNAKTTPSHLHFGIYSFGGAIDPLPFVNRSIKNAPAVADKKLPEQIRLVKAYQANGLTEKKNTLLVPVAVTSKEYIAELPDGNMLQLPITYAQPATQPLKTVKTIIPTALYTSPLINATTSTPVQAGSFVSVLGYFNQYSFVRAGNTVGWLPDSSLKG